MYNIITPFFIVLNIGLVINSNKPQTAQLNIGKGDLRNVLIRQRRYTPIFFNFSNDPIVTHNRKENITIAMDDVKKILNIHYFGMAAVALMGGQMDSHLKHIQLDEAETYSNAYRWILKFLTSFYFSCLDGKPYATHEHFLRHSRARHYLAPFPKVFQKLLPWVSNESWERERVEAENYNKNEDHPWKSDWWYAMYYGEPMYASAYRGRDLP